MAQLETEQGWLLGSKFMNKQDDIMSQTMLAACEEICNKASKEIHNKVSEICYMALSSNLLSLFLESSELDVAWDGFSNLQFQFEQQCDAVVVAISDQIRENLTNMMNHGSRGHQGRKRHDPQKMPKRDPTA